jgi:hypothetical protein
MPTPLIRVQRHLTLSFGSPETGRTASWTLIEEYAMSAGANT